MSPPNPFSHLDDRGEARMVDVSEKPVTRRVAEASCRVRMSPETVSKLGEMPKGDAYAVARLAGIHGAKRTAEGIPLCHSVPLEHLEGTSGKSMSMRLVIAPILQCWRYLHRSPARLKIIAFASSMRSTSGSEMGRFLPRKA